MCLVPGLPARAFVFDLMNKLHIFSCLSFDGIFKQTGAVALKIVLAPDSFKDCLSAAEVCGFMAQGIRRLLPDADVDLLPVADGGEGTLDALSAATGGKTMPVRVTGPLGTPVDSRFAVLGDGRTAVVEMAAASGLMLVPKEKRNPLRTTTYGTGELIRSALDFGAVSLIVCAGGSATTDCGTGMAQALGIRFFRMDEREIREPMTGAAMGEAAFMDASGLHHGALGAQIRVACDVKSPLLGPAGAAMLYSRQKGADEEQAALLERNMEKIAGLIEKTAGRPLRGIPGTGAAGGLALPLIAFAGAELRSGIDLVLKAAGFSERILGADMILTGEGKVDGQTLNGKTVLGVAREAKKRGIPVAALAGVIEGGAEGLFDSGITHMESICPEGMSSDQCIGNAGQLIMDAAERFMRQWISKSKY
jgi:glycerate kinase